MITETTILKIGDRLNAQLNSGIILKFYVKKHNGSTNGLLIMDLTSRTPVGAIFERPHIIKNAIAKHPNWDEIIKNKSLKWD